MSLEFITVGEQGIKIMKLFNVNNYTIEELSQLYAQVSNFLTYRDTLYSQATNNRVNLSEALKQIPEAQNRRFMKGVREILILMDYAKRDVDGLNILVLNSDQYKFEKDYLVPEIEEYIVNVPTEIYEAMLQGNITIFISDVNKILHGLKASLNIIEYLQNGVCVVADPICPFLDSLAVVARGYLMSYSSIKSLDDPDNYSDLAATGSHFKTIYLLGKDVRTLGSEETLIILSLGPGNKISEYLPNYSLEAEENDNKKVIIMAYEPSKIVIPDIKDIYRSYPKKRRRLFGNRKSPGNMFINVMKRPIRLPDTNQDKYNLNYLVVASDIIVKSVINPSLSNKTVILQCGIAPTACTKIYNRFREYNVKVDGFITVRGTENDILVYQILNKEGESKYKNLEGKTMSWEQIKSYII